MATYDRTITGGGTVGHPGNPADSMVIGGTLEVLEASGNANVTLDVGTSTDVDAFVDGGASNAAADIQFNLKAAGGNIVTSADSVQVTILDSGSSGTTALRFRVHAVICDISVNPVESATVSTGT
jgi:hypothetical protein